MPRLVPVLLLALVLLAPLPAGGDEPAYTSKKALAARRDLEKKQAAARKQWDGRVTGAQRTYLKALEAARAGVMRAGDLEEARRIDAVVQWLQTSLAGIDAGGRPEKVEDRRPLSSPDAVAAQRLYLAAVGGATSALREARVAALTAYRSDLDAALQVVLKGGKDLDEAERITAGLRGAQAQLDAIRAEGDWVVLFRSSKPEDWNTHVDQGDRKAMPLEFAPDGTRFLRLRRLDTEAAVILEVSRDALGQDATSGQYGWQGAKVLNAGGLHLGIDNAEWKLTFRDGGRVMIGNGRSTSGWGFGHKVHQNDAQYAAWAGEEVPLGVVFEVAVTARDLEEEETKLLLAPVH
jgi:hypothetical protein